MAMAPPEPASVSTHIADRMMASHPRRASPDSAQAVGAQTRFSLASSGDERRNVSLRVDETGSRAASPFGGSSDASVE